MPILTFGTDATELHQAPPVAPTRPARFLEVSSPVFDRSYRLAGLLLGNAHETEDAVQDALVTAWQGFDALRDSTTTIIDP